MNYIKQLTHFFNMAAKDDNISATQVSLFMALFQKWNKARFKQSIQIIRDEVMALAKINSKATYHRSMAYLHRNNYILYKPSYSPYNCSVIEFFPQYNIQSLTPKCTNSKPVQNLNTTLIKEPFNSKHNSTNIINHNISRARGQKSHHNDKSNSQVQTLEKEKNSAKKEKAIPPLNADVENFFTTNNSILLEAHRFINYYNSNGWLVGGKSPMKDWKAAARNWIANIGKFNTPAYPNQELPNRAKQLNSKTDKNYSEPF